jgi:hypothetical protein
MDLISTELHEGRQHDQRGNENLEPDNLPEFC